MKRSKKAAIFKSEVTYVPPGEYTHEELKKVIKRTSNYRRNDNSQKRIHS
jgi:hypothetical protein